MFVFHVNYQWIKTKKGKSLSKEEEEEENCKKESFLV